MQAPVPLHRYTKLRTADVEEARSAAGRVMSSHRLRAARPREFGARLHAVDIGSSTLLYAVYHGEAEVTALAPMEYYTLQLFLAGAADVVTDFGRRRAGAGQACVISPGERLRLRFAPGTVQVAAKLPRDVVDRGCSRLGAEPAGPLEFDLAVPDGAPWPALLRLAVDTVDRFDTGILPPGTGLELERVLVSALLLGHPRNLRFRGGGARGYRAAGAAAEALKADPATSVTPGQLARTAGVSLRTLQEGFRSRFGTTVTAYHREVRLERAHRLLSAAGERRTVADIAVECGFLHLGRFARDYRLRYGITPSATLHASRAADTAAPTG
ncbi:AraC family transcriptional regulator [Amycolatopsis mongoliensis]|uniref:AraC family transcriptional regulator n=1 Tax=Amycolatopsis mongoliensis TaxID=715475 RepID=A0A9Y2N9X7_9PSEU|nr:AraC family transcriptional regulator [Amycolatopsis sp. 4-36]WIX98020.1 AraC family transcriptional regulator [Amycolatopsis sp. 4-36]